MSKYFILIVILLLIVGGVILFLNSGSDTSSDNNPGIVNVEDDSEVEPENNDNSDTDNSNSDTNTDTSETKVFILTGENFKFIMNGDDNPDLIVNEGDKVRIEFTSTSGFHDWVVDEFNAATSKVNEGGTTSIEFTADKKGQFEYYCSVGSHRSLGMKGNLIVQ